MNPWQMALQLRHELRKAVWPGDDGQVVFGSRGVIATAGAPTDDEALPEAMPFAIVAVDVGAPDDDAPDLIEQTFNILSVTEVQGDPTGESVIVGGPRADLGLSAGAGVLELGARARAAVENLTGADGVTIQASATSTGASGALGDGRHIAYDEFTVTAVCTSDNYYAPPQQLHSSSSVWRWEGGQCERRHDFLGYKVGYVTGSTPMRSIDDAEEIVYDGADAEWEPFTVKAGATYSVFATYGARGRQEGASRGDDVGAFDVR